MTKAERAVKNKAWREANVEKIKADKKAYREANAEKIKANKKAYLQTPQGKKTNRIGRWKQLGIISDDFEALYEKYLGTINCEDCECVLTEDKRTTSTTRCQDHCHKTGLPRAVVCQACNRKRG
tara:strand:- start:453 stop:824 length:372 start_codon:yes stop_codon:yes gene_type:complete